MEPGPHLRDLSCQQIFRSFFNNNQVMAGYELYEFGNGPLNKSRSPSLAQKKLQLLYNCRLTLFQGSTFVHFFVVTPYHQYNQSW